jgi:hypothetical protein
MRDGLRPAKPVKGLPRSALRVDVQLRNGWTQVPRKAVARLVQGRSVLLRAERWYRSTHRLCSSRLFENWCVPSFFATK